jgi:hypothetical protein
MDEWFTPDFPWLSSGQLRSWSESGLLPPRGVRVIAIVTLPSSHLQNPCSQPRQPSGNVFLSTIFSRYTRVALRPTIPSQGKVE